jgi:hypothetical protein
MALGEAVIAALFGLAIAVGMWKSNYDCQVFMCGYLQGKASPRALATTLTAEDPRSPPVAVQKEDPSPSFPTALIGGMHEGSGDAAADGRPPVEQGMSTFC